MNDFYAESPEDSLRLGDVVVGFQVATPHVDEPACDMPNAWRIAVHNPRYLAVMTPCCSIEGKAVALAPLVPIRPRFLQSEYLAEDFTRVNRKVKPENILPRHVWDNELTPEQREEKLAQGPGYILYDCFVYACHDLLQSYRVDCKKEVNTNFYMVDFKDIFRVNCDRINRKGQSTLAPPGTKLLQLSIATRQELRDKLMFYFSRKPEEDEL